MHVIERETIHQIQKEGKCRLGRDCCIENPNEGHKANDHPAVPDKKAENVRRVHDCCIENPDEGQMVNNHLFVPDRTSQNESTRIGRAHDALW